MKESCACKKHEFEFQYHDGDEVLICPVCSREYTVFMDMDEDGELQVDLTLSKDIEQIE